MSDIHFLYDHKQIGGCLVSVITRGYCEVEGYQEKQPVSSDLVVIIRDFDTSKYCRIRHNTIQTPSLDEMLSRTEAHIIVSKNGHCITSILSVNV
jgi:hypothetical protein